VYNKENKILKSIKTFFSKLLLAITIIIEWMN